MLLPEHMPHLPTLKTIPLEGNPVSREVRLLAVQGRRYSPALDAFIKVARLRDWTVEVPHQGIPLEVGGIPENKRDDLLDRHFVGPQKRPSPDLSR